MPSIKDVLKLGEWIKEIDYVRYDGKDVAFGGCDIDFLISKGKITLDFDMFRGDLITNVQANHYPRHDRPDEIKVGGKDVEQDDVDLQIKWGKIKYRLEYKDDTGHHKIILTASLF